MQELYLPFNAEDCALGWKLVPVDQPPNAVALYAQDTEALSMGALVCTLPSDWRTLLRLSIAIQRSVAERVVKE